MSRNFSFGSRDPLVAVAMRLEKEAALGNRSFGSVAACKSRFGDFLCFGKELGIFRLEQVTSEIVMAYGEHLRHLVEDNDLKPSTAQNRISAVNVVMKLGDPYWKVVRPVADCNIPKRSNIRRLAPPNADTVIACLHPLKFNGLELVSCVAELADSLGLRCMEASLLDCKKALKQAQKLPYVTISDGTKGDKKRRVPIKTDHQREVLARAAELQGAGRNLINEGMEWIEWVNGPIREGRVHLKAAGVKGYHELRAAYACRRYLALTGLPAPCVGGKRQAESQVDLDARMKIAEELGHNRVDVVASYVGGRK